MQPAQLTVRSAATAASDGLYFHSRSAEERDAARHAAGGQARRAHEQLARLYTELALTRKQEAIERREAMLDDALDDSFPASDPPAIVAPGPREYPH